MSFWIRNVTPSTVGREILGVMLAGAHEAISEAVPELSAEAVMVPFVWTGETPLGEAAADETLVDETSVEEAALEDMSSVEETAAEEI
jgi:hypothetical protein